MQQWQSQQEHENQDSSSIPRQAFQVHLYIITFKQVTQHSEY